MTRPRRSVSYRIAQLAGWLMLLSMLGVLAYGAFRKGPSCVTFSDALIGVRVFEAPPCMQLDDDVVLYEAHIDTELGRIDAVLDPSISTASVNTFVFLARTGWYDGSVFHRVERTDDHAYAQGGAANPDGTGHAGFLVDERLPSPILTYRIGLLAMVATDDDLHDPVTQVSSQFFIIGDEWEAIAASSGSLPRYPLLGSVSDVRSLGVLRQIIQLGSEEGTPSRQVRILSVTIDEIRDETSASPSPSPTAT